MTFYPLASSSKGNAYLLSDGRTNVLVECGLTCKELRRRTPVPISSIDAVFLTHEHKDHSKCAAQLIRNGTPVYMSYGTAKTLNLQDALVLDSREVVHIGGVTVMPFDVFHDASNPFGYIFRDENTMEKLLFATDTANVNVIVPGLTHVAIECNYAEDLLCRPGRLPEKTKARIRHSHMEVGTAIKYLHKLDLSSVQTIYLMHMSSSYSDFCGFLGEFQREFPGIDIKICRE